MTLLDIDLQQKTYPNGVCTLRNLQFQADEGEFIALVGPSGSGKSTLLNLIAGLDRNFEGRIDHPAELPLSFMFQEPRLMPWLSVEENIRLVLEAPCRRDDPDRFVHMEALLAQLGLADFRSAFPGQLSGGMKRRAALVRAFVTRPKLLLMDEPFQSLDEPTAEGLRQLLLQIWAQSRPTVLFVTHNLNEALLLADRVLFLSHRPARVILDYKVPLERPRPLQLSQLQPLQEQLLSQHPQLLSGIPTFSQPDGA